MANADTVYGSLGSDRIYAGNGNDIIYGDDNDDIIYSGTGADRIYNGDGADLLDGGTPSFGGTFVTGHQDHFFGGDGNDRLFGSSNIVHLYGDGVAEIDTISGGAGSDTVTGLAGGDSIDGGDGADIICGGTGRDLDTLTGGLGMDQDHFSFESMNAAGSSGVDSITDFNVSQKDKLYLNWNGDMDVALAELQAITTINRTANSISVVFGERENAMSLTIQSMSNLRTLADNIGEFNHIFG